MAFSGSSTYAEKAGFVPTSQSYYTDGPLPDSAFSQEPVRGRRVRGLTLAVILVACCMLVASCAIWYHGRPVRTHLAIPNIQDGDDDGSLAANTELDVDFEGPDFQPDAPDLSDGDLGQEMADEIGRQLGTEIGEELGRQIGEEIGEEMGRQIGEEIGRQMEVDLDAEMVDMDFDDDESVLRLPAGSGKRVKELLGSGMAAVAGSGRKALGAVGRVVGKRQTGDEQP